MSTGRRISTARKTALAILITGVVVVVFSAGSASGQRDRAAGDQGAKLIAGAQVAQVADPNDPRRAAIEAFKEPGGPTLGQAQVHRPFGDVDSQMSITCLIVRGNQAIVGGKITSSTDPASVGWTGAFAIQDEPDKIGFFLTNGDQSITCSNYLAKVGETSITGVLTDFGVPNEQSVVTIGQTDQ